LGCQAKKGFASLDQSGDVEETDAYRSVFFAELMGLRRRPSDAILRQLYQDTLNE